MLKWGIAASQIRLELEKACSTIVDGNIYIPRYDLDHCQVRTTCCGIFSN